MLHFCLKGVFSPVKHINSSIKVNLKIDFSLTPAALWLLRNANTERKPTHLKERVYFCAPMLQIGTTNIATKKITK